MNDPRPVAQVLAPDRGHADIAAPAGSPGSQAHAGRPAHGDSDSRARSGTRARIQQVAVELFTEHGYEGTSLREIAERLDVTKAALYYHFRSKEDIVTSLVEDYSKQMDGLIEWGREQPRTAATRREILRRYVDIVAEGDKVFRMLHQNQAAVSMLSSAKSRGELFKERVVFIIDLLTEPGAGLPERIRAAMAVGSISVAWMLFADQANRHDLVETVRDIATDIAEMGRTGPTPPG